MTGDLISRSASDGDAAYVSELISLSIWYEHRTMSLDFRLKLVTLDYVGSYETYLVSRRPCCRKAFDSNTALAACK